MCVRRKKEKRHVGRGENWIVWEILENVVAYEFASQKVGGRARG